MASADPRDRTQPALGYYLGLPAWGFPGWTDTYFPRPAGSGSALGHYARVFNTVEGNTTFYRVPDAPTVARWAAAVRGSAFRFTFKIPQSVTHQRRPNWDDLANFMAVVEPLGEHLGPFLVQCPASLGPDDLHTLDTLFSRMPTCHRYCLEVRHPDFFSRPGILEPLLSRYRAGRVMFDSRPIYQGDSQHPEVLAARHKKPDVPLLDEVYNDLVYARVVLHPDAAQNPPFVREWLDRTQGYLAKGYTVYFMMHCPNNQHCPAFAGEFHSALRRQLNGKIPDLPPWPMPQQESLF